MILMIVFLFGLFQPVVSIKCFTCSEGGSFFCPVPLTIDAGEENNENDIPSVDYDFDYVCETTQYIDPKTLLEKIILRGTRYCKEINIPNYRRDCCKTDNCNKYLSSMTIDPTIYSNDQRYLIPSIVLIIFSVIFQYVQQL